MGNPPWEAFMNNVNKHLSENDLDKLHPASMQVKKRTLYTPLQPHFWWLSVTEGEIELNVVQIITLTRRPWLHNSRAKHTDPCTFAFNIASIFLNLYFKEKIFSEFFQNYIWNLTNKFSFKLMSLSQKANALGQ